MKFGTFSHAAWPEGASQGEIYQHKLDQVVLAEELGFDSVWLAEHQFSRFGTISSLPVFLSHVPAKTSRLRLGTAVSILPQRDLGNKALSWGT